FDLVIKKVNGPNPGRIKYITFGDPITTNEFAVDTPSITPHAAAVGAVAVAAAPYYNHLVAEPFTSLGPSTILFSPTGTPLSSPDVRQTPRITSIDGTNTTFFGSDSSRDADTFPNFFGTSASSPHAAA